MEFKEIVDRGRLFARVKVPVRARSPENGSGLNCGVICCVIAERACGDPGKPSRALAADSELRLGRWGCLNVVSWWEAAIFAATCSAKDFAESVESSSESDHASAGSRLLRRYDLLVDAILDKRFRPHSSHPMSDDDRSKS